MDQIPLELFIRITSYLSCTQKLKLLLVCRGWHEVLKNTNLFEHFSVKGKTRFDASMKYFKNKERCRSQVRNLRLIKPEAGIETILDIPVMFPSLQNFAWAGYCNADYDTDLSEEQLRHWQKLKEFEEVNPLPLFTSLLRSGIFFQLTKIKINFHFRRTLCDDLFNHIGNAPKLDKLELSCLVINLQAMEKLHQNAPQLSILYLADATQDPRNLDGELVQEELVRNYDGRNSSVIDMFLKPIEPAKGLVSLHISHMKQDNGEFGLESRWLTYISKKYTYITSLIIDGMYMTRTRYPYYEDRLAAIARVCSNLKMYKVHLYPLTSRIVDEMDHSGAKLETLEIVGTVDDQLSGLINSQQKHHIETLKIKNTCYGSEFFSLFGQFSKLKHLDIRRNGPSDGCTFVPLDTLLRQVKQLEFLRLSSCDIGLDQEQTLQKDSFTTNIKYLVMDSVLILNSTPLNKYVDVMGFISRTCPGMLKLDVQGEVKDITLGPLMMHFPGHYFNFIKVSIFGNSLYKVDNNQLVAWYQFREGSKTFDREAVRSSFENQFHVSIIYEGRSALTIRGQAIQHC